MNKEDITKKDFEAYEEVRQSGVTNMFMASKVSELSGLSKTQILAIMQDYSYLNTKFTDVRK